MMRRVPTWVRVWCCGLLLSGCGAAPNQKAVAPPPAPTTSTAQTLECPPWAEPASDAKVCESTRLTQFLEEMGPKLQAEPGPETPKWFDPFVDELSQKYVAEFDTLEPLTRLRLLKVLVAHPDPRSVPALRKALQEYARAPKDKNYPDLALACEAAAALPRPASVELRQDLLAAFLVFRFSTQTGGLAYKPLTRALLGHRDRSWVKPLIATLEVDFPAPGHPAKDPGAAKAFNDQVFRQVTSAQLLGLLGNPLAVDPLLRVTLDPAKGSVFVTAMFALVKLGRPARERTKALLQGNVPELVAFANERVKRSDEPESDESPHVGTAALVLGVMGHPDVESVLVAASKRERGKNLYAVAGALARVGSATSENAFKEAFSRIDPQQRHADRPALAELAEKAAHFSDPALVPWLLQRAKLARGTAAGVKEIRVALLNTAMQLMKPDQAGQVEASIKSFGSSEQAKQFALAKALVLKCTDASQCYLTELLSPENQTPERVSVSTKAAHMLAAFGDTATRDQLVHGWSSISQPEVASAAAEAIDHLTPNGSRELADELEAIVDSQATSPRGAQLTAPLQTVAYRVRSRAPERTLGKDG